MWLVSSVSTSEGVAEVGAEARRARRRRRSRPAPPAPAASGCRGRPGRPPDGPSRSTRRRRRRARSGSGSCRRAALQVRVHVGVRVGEALRRPQLAPGRQRLVDAGPRRRVALVVGVLGRGLRGRARSPGRAAPSAPPAPAPSARGASPAAAERVPDDGDRSSPCASSVSSRSCTCCSVCHGGTHGRAPVPAQVDRDDAVPGQPLARQPVPAQPVARDAVHRQDRRPVVGPERVRVELGHGAGMVADGAPTAFLRDVPTHRPRRRDRYAHFRRIPTRWMDVDVYGHVNNVVYYAYFDTVINGYLVDAGVLDPHGGDVVGFARETMCRFHRPDRLPPGRRRGAARRAHRAHQRALRARPVRRGRGRARGRRPLRARVRRPRTRGGRRRCRTTCARPSRRSSCCVSRAAGPRARRHPRAHRRHRAGRADGAAPGRGDRARHPRGRRAAAAGARARRAPRHRAR